MSNIKEENTKNEDDAMRTDDVEEEDDDGRVVEVTYTPHRVSTVRPAIERMNGDSRIVCRAYNHCCDGLLLGRDLAGQMDFMRHVLGYDITVCGEVPIAYVHTTMIPEDHAAFTPNELLDFGIDLLRNAVPEYQTFAVVLQDKEAQLLEFHAIINNAHLFGDYARDLLRALVLADAYL